ncbi:hypothetical protein, partial [Novosphingobium sp.]|uniref:hypothetical protein n=1 Tax=Novosphingobium sp. TaxID=1874826 RepID=UPI0035B3F0C8
PASCSFKIAMICSSLNLLRFISSDSLASDSTKKRSHFRGARHPLEVTDEVDAIVCAVAEQACAAIGIPVAGLDLILSRDGEQVVCYVLEINQRPHIGGHSLPIEGPGQGNAVAEAIIDYYFPETIRDQTHPTLAYDFTPLRDVLNSGQITALSLPVIGPDWRVMRFVETGIAAKAMASLIKTAALAAGIFVMIAPAAKGGLELSWQTGHCRP